MHYLLFNSDVFVSDGGDIHRYSPAEFEAHDRNGIHKALVCLLDVDVFVTTAPESVPEAKDAILSKAFLEKYPGEYVLQDERIGLNQYQVVGALTDKVRKIYQLLPANTISTFIPYAHAIRAFLSQHGVKHDEIVAFVDDIKGEIFLTFFKGLQFSKTRRFNELESSRLASEIRRSAIGFTKDVGKDNTPFRIIANNAVLSAALEKHFEGQLIDVLPATFPCIEGLKTAQFTTKFELPEEIIKRAKERQRRSQIPAFAIASLLLAIGGGFFLFWNITRSVALSGLSTVTNDQLALERELEGLDQQVYRSSLKAQKDIHFGDVYLLVRAMIPDAYDIESLSFSSRKSGWGLDITLSLKNGMALEDVRLRKPFTDFTVKDVLLKDRPGKQIRIEL